MPNSTSEKSVGRSQIYHSESCASSTVAALSLLRAKKYLVPLGFEPKTFSGLYSKACKGDVIPLHHGTCATSVCIIKPKSCGYCYIYVRLALADLDKVWWMRGSFSLLKGFTEHFLHVIASSSSPSSSLSLQSFALSSLSRYQAYPL